MRFDSFRNEHQRKHNEAKCIWLSSLPEVGDISNKHLHSDKVRMWDHGDLWPVVLHHSWPLTPRSSVVLPHLCGRSLVVLHMSFRSLLPQYQGSRSVFSTEIWFHRVFSNILRIFKIKFASFLMVLKPE